MILSSLWGHCEGCLRGSALGMEAWSGAAGFQPCGSFLSSSSVLSSYVPPAWLPSSPLLFSQTKDDYGETACTQQASSANQQIPKASTASAAATAAATAPTTAATTAATTPAATAATTASATAWLGPTELGWSTVHTYHWHRAPSAMPPGTVPPLILGGQGCSNMSSSYQGYPCYPSCHTLLSVLASSASTAHTHYSQGTGPRTGTQR